VKYIALQPTHATKNRSLQKHAACAERAFNAIHQRECTYGQKLPAVDGQAPVHGEDGAFLGILMPPCRRNGGEGGIRTRGGCLAPTRFPGVRLKPLIHLSGDGDFSRAMSPAGPPRAARHARRSAAIAPHARPALQPPEARRSRRAPRALRRADCTRTARPRRGTRGAAKAFPDGPRRSSRVRPNLCTRSTRRDR
jgi:hypothetical protein